MVFEIPTSGFWRMLKTLENNNTLVSLPLVSIVMPSLNQVAFVEQAIHSVLVQNYPHLELIVADGNSTDGTQDILARLKTVFGSRLIWHSEPDTGPANAINKALRQAKGNIIGWLNSDDSYTTDCIARAVTVLQNSPETIMVYGDGLHIDEQGNVINIYPTKPPSSTLIDFQTGCYICQPTVFLKRAVFDKVGLLDETIKTAFDFELWLRIFKNYPNRIDYIPKIQGLSRLHQNCITMRQRRLVALEGMEVLFRHLGTAWPHWILTYFEELCAIYPHEDSPYDLKQHMLETIKTADKFITIDNKIKLTAQLENDKRWQLACPGLFVGVYPDGWSSQQLVIRLGKMLQTPFLELHCENAQPNPSIIKLKITNSWNQQEIIYSYATRYFSIKIEIPFFLEKDKSYLFINSHPLFIPKEIDLYSLDCRELTFKINNIFLS